MTLLAMSFFASCEEALESLTKRRIEITAYSMLLLMLTVFWDMKVMLLTEVLPRVKSSNYCATLTKLCPDIRDKRRATNQHIRLLHDNARLMFSRPVSEKLQGYSWKVLEHPPYSSNLVPSDFHLFGPMKKSLGGKKVDSDDKLKWDVRRGSFSQLTEFYETGIFKLIHCWDKCLNMYGSYAEK
ncbi:Mariner Mos1 transposase [Araneus ventricosus]|uniref:Mariner Mos1 transposase n=1 Tax=Araneus ventricosus TaxID=182803 RepID=A0A4Y2LSB9_ARAVE|nr:Mariner Mos1 transposase [Araneus ventricosus]